MFGFCGTSANLKTYKANLKTYKWFAGRVAKKGSASCGQRWEKPISSSPKKKKCAPKETGERLKTKGNLEKRYGSTAKVLKF